MHRADKRLDHVSKVVLTTTKVRLDPPVVFMCGGNADVRVDPPRSTRGAFLKYLARNDPAMLENIRLAEDFKDWNHGAAYHDLMIFEDDIAHIASLIVIFLESAGSLAELGVFARNKRINNKILVFVSDDHFNQDSFIRYGPLDHLIKIKETSVCAYPLVDGVINNFADVKSDIDLALSGGRAEVGFDVSNEGHVAFYIYQVISIFKALLLTEVEEYVGRHFVGYKREKIKRLLFLLLKFDYIVQVKRGHSDFYCPNKLNERVVFGGRFDKVTAAVDAMRYYMDTPSESRRLGVVTENSIRIGA